MVQSILPGAEAIRIDLLSTDPKHYAINNGSAPYFRGWSGSAPLRSDDIHAYDDGDLTNKAGVARHVSVFSGQVGTTANFHFDFHFKLWVIPNLLQLSNPQLNSNIPFRLWNTNENPETIGSVLVNGSNVLTFDITPGNTILDFQYRLVNMQIDEGEPNVDATVQFSTEELTGILTVLAAISDTFNLIPDVPVKEIWDFKTDILRNVKGVDQRIALRRYPRLRQEFDVEIIDLRQRREQYELLRRNIKVQSLVPQYQYASNATGITPIAGTTIFLDPTRGNFRVGGQLVAINPTTENTVLGQVLQINADNVVINSGAGFEIDPHWIVMPAISCIINDGSSIEMQNVTGMLTIKADTFREPQLLRPGATRTIGNFDSIPHLDRRPLIPAEENIEYSREILDNDIGARDISSQWLQPKISGNRKFVIQRNADPEEMDYWRSFFDTIRGSWKSFLLSTWFPDLTLNTLPDQGAAALSVNEGYYAGQFWIYDGYKRIQIEYINGDQTQHVVLAATSEVDGSCTISLSPSIPDDPEYDGGNITSISFLTKVRATDRVVWRHFANYSEVSFGIETTDS